MAFTKFYTQTLYSAPSSKGSKDTIFYKDRRWNVQKAPYTRPLSFAMAMGKLDSVHNTEEFTYTFHPGYTAYGVRNVLSDQAYNQTYKAFISKMKADSAELLTAYVERGKTVDMVAGRVMSLVNGIKAAKRGDVRTLKRLWGSGAGIRQNVKRSGGHVLEYSFGWAPTVSDIANTVAVFKNGVPPVRIAARRGLKKVEKFAITAAYSGFDNLTTEVSWQLGAEVRISNPDLALANQLGLINPVSTLWEITPWSFVFDYFVNLGDFIAGISDFVGYEVTNSYTTIMWKKQRSMLKILKDASYKGKYDQGYNASGVTVERSVGEIPRPTLRFNPPWRISTSRASTSVALLLQQLRK